MATPLGAPRPRVLMVNASDEEVGIVKALSGSVTSTSDLEAVHAEEYDVLALFGGQFSEYADRYHRRLVFAPPPSTGVNDTVESVREEIDGRYTFPSRVATRSVRARDFVISEHAHSLGLEGLLTRSCYPSEGATYTGFFEPVFPPRISRPLLLEALDKPLILAGIHDARKYEGELADSAIWLPNTARAALREWINFAFDLWRADDPASFPVNEEWTKDEQWLSLSEIEQQRQLESFESEEAARRDAADIRRRELSDALVDAQTAGRVWRELVTETGDSLVAAVGETLRALGFDVTDADTLAEHKDLKREDLRVSDGAWTALVEVKGYTKGAKSNDLNQVTGAAVAYAITEHRAPDALWYVVNTERNIDPSKRGTPLAGREDDLRSFAEMHNGCLIDSRDLFAVRQRVARGIISATEARAQLKAARGRASSAPVAPSEIEEGPAAPPATPPGR